MTKSEAKKQLGTALANLERVADYLEERGFKQHSRRLDEAADHVEDVSEEL